MAPAFKDCELVIVEGDVNQEFPCIEVWRAELGDPPVCSEHGNISLLVTDDPPPVATIPVIPRGDLKPLLQWIELQQANR
jgi:hypothetical protein